MMNKKSERKNVLVSFADRLSLRRVDHRVNLCRLVEHVFRDVGLPWSEIAIVRSRDRSRYACLVAVPSDCLVRHRLEVAAVRAACMAWERLRLDLNARDFYWRVGESNEHARKVHHAAG